MITTEENDPYQNNPSSATIRLGGLILAIGSLCIGIVSYFYAISPKAATMPVVTSRLGEAWAATQGIQDALRPIGLFGLTGDIIFVVGALILAICLILRKQIISATGLLTTALSSSLFVAVDALVGRTLGITTMDLNSAGAFLLAKSLSDSLFIAATFASGLGLLLFFIPRLFTPTSLRERIVPTLGTIVGVSGTLIPIFCLLGADMGPLLGLSIGAGSALFLIIGIRTAITAKI